MDEVHLFREDTPFIKMLIRGAQKDNASRPGDTLVCIACNKSYVRGNYDFHQLCDSCFNEFDSQKMNARFKSLDSKEFPKYFEDSEEWALSKKNSGV